MKNIFKSLWLVIKDNIGTIIFYMFIISVNLTAAILSFTNMQNGWFNISLFIFNTTLFVLYTGLLSILLIVGTKEYIKKFFPKGQIVSNNDPYGEEDWSAN